MDQLRNRRFSGVSLLNDSVTVVSGSGGFGFWKLESKAVTAGRRGNRLPGKPFYSCVLSGPQALVSVHLYLSWSRFPQKMYRELWTGEHSVVGGL